MDIYIYDENLSPVDIIDKVYSVDFTKRFFSADEFEISLVADEKALALIKEQTFIEIPNKISGIILKTRKFNDENNCSKIIANGVSFDGIFTKRILSYKSYDDSLFDILERNAGSTAYHSHRKLQHSVFNHENDVDNVVFESTMYKSLDAFINLNGQLNDFGICSKIAHSCENNIEFYGRFSKNYSLEQDENPPIVFSKDSNFVDSINYNYNKTHEVNSAVAYSTYRRKVNGYYDTGFFVEHFEPVDNASGYLLSENGFYIQPDVTSVSSEVGEHTYTYTTMDNESMTELAESLYKYELRYPSEYTIIKSFDKRILQGFLVGDIVSYYDKEYDKLFHSHIFEIKEHHNFEALGENYYELTLGNPNKTIYIP